MVQSNPRCISLSLTRDKGDASESCAVDLFHRRVVMDVCSGGRFEKAHVIESELIPPVISSAKPGPRSRISGHLFLTLI